MEPGHRGVPPLARRARAGGGLGGCRAAGGSDEPRRLDFLVDILRGTHTKDKLATYKAILDRWAGADTTPIALKPRTMGPKR
jgi:hypothetical protein